VHASAYGNQVKAVEPEKIIPKMEVSPLGVAI